MTTQQLTPTPTTGLDDIREVGAGWKHACGLRANGRVMCWGRGNSGQLGTGTPSQQTMPAIVVWPPP